MPTDEEEELVFALGLDGKRDGILDNGDGTGSGHERGRKKEELRRGHGNMERE